MQKTAQTYLSSRPGPVTKPPIIFLGYVQSGSSLELRLALEFNGEFPINRKTPCASYANMQGQVHSVLSEFMMKIKEIGISRFRLANGGDFKQFPPMLGCRPIPTSIVGDFAGRLLYFVKTFMSPEFA